MYNSKWLAVHGDTLYYIDSDHHVRKVHITNDQRSEVVLYKDVNDTIIVDLLVDIYGTLVVMTDEGYVARGHLVRKLVQCKQYYHLLRAGKKFLCIGYDEDSSDMIICTVSSRLSIVKMLHKMKVEFAPYCVTTAPLGDENGDQFLLFVGEFYNGTRVSTYMVTVGKAHHVETRSVLSEGTEGKQW